MNLEHKLIVFLKFFFQRIKKMFILVSMWFLLIP